MEKGKRDEFLLSAGAKTDFFIDGHSNVRVANAKTELQEISGDFVITVQVEPGFRATYDAGAIFVIGDDDHWIKVAFELTDLGYTSVVTVITNGFSDDCNGERSNESALLLRLIRKNDYWSAHYSSDGEKWSMIRYFHLKLPTTIKGGVVAQSPTGEGCTVKFSGLKITDEEIKNLRSGQ